MLYGNLPDVKLADDTTVKGFNFRVSYPPKRAVLRLPTSEELLDWLEQGKVVKRNLGRGKSKVETRPNPKGDAALFAKIRMDKDGPDFDAEEIADALNKLVYCEVVNCEDAEAEYDITLATPFGDTSVTLRKASVKEISTYRLAVRSRVDLPNGGEEYRHRLTPAVTLFDSLFQKSEGYLDNSAAGIPPNHKNVSLIAAIEALDQIDVALDPNS